MSTGNAQIFDSSAGNTSAWLKISDYSSWSLEAVGLETGGTLAVMVSNSNPSSGPPVTAEAGTGIEMNVPTAAGSKIGTITPTSPFFFGPGVAQWLSIVKTPGGTPTETFVRIFGQQV